MRVFACGELEAEIAPGPFLGGGTVAFAIEDATVHELTDVGVTLALAPDGDRPASRQPEA